MNNIRYADDVVLLASSAQELQELVSRVEQASAKYGLQINVNKSKVMTTNGDKVSIIVDQEVMEQVGKFTYLGAIISEDCFLDEEIKARLTKGRIFIRKMKNIWKDNKISIRTKK